VSHLEGRINSSTVSASLFGITLRGALTRAKLKRQLAGVLSVGRVRRAFEFM
jgi:hypothetical protein